ncbi:MAG TPA: FHA domain-containing protein [Thermobifida alba]|nr:FHA domain-containing protein [Thermobifida alba]
MTDAAAPPVDSPLRPHPRATVTTPDGTVHDLAPGMRLCFGRSRRADIVVRPDDPKLSRIAGEIAVEAGGVRITNRSSTHLLRVVMRGRTTDLPQTAAATPAASFVLVEGTVAVGSPTMHAEHQVLQVTVAPGEPDPRPGPLPATEETSTVGPWEIDTETRYFAVALALCQDRLENPAASGRVPTAKETTLAVLRLTHCHHHLGRIRAGDAATLGRLTKRVEDHLKYLRKLLRDKGQLPRGVEHLSKQSLAHYLVDLEILRPEHLELRTDPRWLAVQEQLWWDE